MRSDLEPHLDPDVAETAGLAHDLGHPPFGHAAEAELQRLLVGSNTDSFEGNAQSFRMVTRLAARRYDRPGLNLTRASLRAIMKYPWPHLASHAKARRKWSSFYADEDDYMFAMNEETSLEWFKNPTGIFPEASLEAQIMDWADDVTYAVHDLEDFFRVGAIPLRAIVDQEGTWDQFCKWVEHRWSVFNTPDPRGALACAHSLLRAELKEDRLAEGQCREVALADFSSRTIHDCVTKVQVVQHDGPNGTAWKLERPVDLDRAIEALKELVWYFVIEGPPMAVSQTGQRQMIRTVFEFFREEALKMTTKVPNRHLPPLTLQAAERQLQDPFPPDIHRIACDAVCELTEAQVIRLYGRLTGHSPAAADLFGNEW